jgi:hypothetical protein
MELKKPLESIGWLSSTGYQTVIDEKARRAAQAQQAERQRQEVQPNDEEGEVQEKNRS